MEQFHIVTDPRVEAKFNSYPDTVRLQMQVLRALVIETAEEMDTISEIEETLKWGEPSYVTNIGSTLRMDWKSKTPQQYALYFQCNSRLIETFKAVFGSKFNYEGKRALVFNLKETLPKEALKHCISTALSYHKVKHLPSLGL